ncbi:4Fe-4S dicluster domain-containing protein [Salipaludibacillus daqingensis]|uniref:4Fe-4S dicluster domain-containing protein n=1 Tax=Salipaludibacillus daqingensis TaxID=3041001 RepID=UPI0024730106|nr:4Fe-4S binding protein [Salipaludibacillus daqingensis]
MRVEFNEDRCKGCSLCVSVCPQGIVRLSTRMNIKGYQAAEVVDQEACTSCAACARMCPDSAITVYRPIKNKQRAS